MNISTDKNKRSVVDTITLSVIQNKLRHICSEMDISHEKASFSPVISEAFDRSNGIYDINTGDVIAQGEWGLPIFMGVMQETARDTIAKYPALNEGDIVVVNDPYRGGTHLQDVRMVKAVFYQGKPWCLLANTGHWPDIGGMVPGGFACQATEIEQEGLRIPPVKLCRQGVMDEDILDMILTNIRVSQERFGDIRAQIGALQVGENRIVELLDRYGVDVVSSAISELHNRSEQQVRTLVSEIPNGKYTSQSFIDSDGVDVGRLTISLTLTVKNGELTFDFTGSSKPCRGPLNSTWATTQASVYVAMKHIMPEVLVNAGCFRPFNIVPPEGTFLYARYPRPVSGCSSETSQRIMEAIFLALSQAIPERLFAAPFGTSGNFTLGGYDPEKERHYIMYFFSGGGYGGWWAGDGLTNGTSIQGISKTQPVEILEQRYPLLVEEYALRENSAGAGKYRGGFGVNYRMRLLRGRAVASFLMDHGAIGPPGILGGESGASNCIELEVGGRQVNIPHVSKGSGFALSPGDAVQVRTPGGGGYGDAADRDLESLAVDRARGYFRTAEKTDD
ncbi:hydantoinase B/oxoprolinase family protein [Hoeflea sp. G2-23]|uniref:Hydantoinase B/oxoprolinase family protein n=1 Tax=Hoeflea algicola TaxID=2983763 RepID=A0ABT3ZDE3_9HYPH|nr:hydantoinase B/oxoprolinase family protein [Hoeflea algicola]MCY0149814.1 hydantoinase B/oxoprolinase family protein [Hoeflea algicola]